MLMDVRGSVFGLENVLWSLGIEKCGLDKEGF
jgi:hypothetical protein